ncbi:LytTR family DNA-binding domain-containing protein [Mucilaginibacter sp. SMC90]|jgi:DNA-binding LytR/AlgR family response regulator|uniref:Response regulator transcription factor n=1 Tax=Mucilaginibacter rubeus TaxID=2027860 RepID=A0A5C1I2H3_9SPHI|nr:MULTISPECIES: LytTR family DNA-binding domain-containing protein [Mucilaginibacter]QEM12432.1 response regulator transcription factor [Mucilaginibacter rubeus]UOE48752.1 LytTR family DNA-binding domain-containing protein [Mucilaginibacter sp. SMC90]
MNLTCYIVDDESGAIDLLTEYIARMPGLELTGATQDPMTALDQLTGEHAPDITFIDIDMRLLSGLELAGMVNLYTMVVFTTAFPQYALQAFSKEAFDYILKPISYDRFADCVHRAKRKIARRSKVYPAGIQDFFNIKSEIKGRMVRIQMDEVVYIEGAGNYITIHTRDTKHMTYLTIKEIIPHLPSYFARIHRSFIVNINYIRITERARVRLENGRVLVMGNNYKESFLEMMDARLIKTGRAS